MYAYTYIHKHINQKTNPNTKTDWHQTNHCSSGMLMNENKLTLSFFHCQFCGSSHKGWSSDWWSHFTHQTGNDVSSWESKKKLESHSADSSSWEARQSDKTEVPEKTIMLGNCTAFAFCEIGKKTRSWGNCKQTAGRVQSMKRMRYWMRISSGSCWMHARWNTAGLYTRNPMTLSGDEARKQRGS